LLPTSTSLKGKGRGVQGYKKRSGLRILASLAWKTKRVDKLEELSLTSQKSKECELCLGEGEKVRKMGAPGKKHSLEKALLGNLADSTEPLILL